MYHEDRMVADRLKTTKGKVDEDWNYADEQLAKARLNEKARMDEEWEELRRLEAEEEARETQLTEREREERARRRAREKRLEDFHKANSIQPAINPGLPTSQPHIIDELHKAAQASLLEMQAEFIKPETLPHMEDLEAHMGLEREAQREAFQDSSEQRKENEDWKRKLRESTKFM
jgi:3-oxoacyl-ACP reductase-like protein